MQRAARSAFDEEVLMPSSKEPMPGKQSDAKPAKMRDPHKDPHKDSGRSRQQDQQMPGKPRQQGGGQHKPQQG